MLYTYFRLILDAPSMREFSVAGQRYQAVTAPIRTILSGLSMSARRGSRR